jgi:hypothetical protein
MSAPTVRRRRALGCTFTVTGDDHVAVERANEIFSAFRFDPDDNSRCHHHIVVGSSGVHRDHVTVDAAVRPPVLLTQVVGHLTQAVVADAGNRYALFHAAAAERSGGALVLPAPSESGKTTLVAGLVDAGFAYLSDEVAAIEPRSRLVMPYPKPLSIDPGSWNVLAHMAPDDDEYHATQWQVLPPRIAPPSPVRWIVFPTYAEGEPTELVPIRASEVVAGLARNSFNFTRNGSRWLPVLAGIAKRCAGYRLRVGDLNSAVDALVDLTS